MEVVIFIALVVLVIVLIKLNLSIKLYSKQNNNEIEDIKDALKGIINKLEGFDIPVSHIDKEEVETELIPEIKEEIQPVVQLPEIEKEEVIAADAVHDVTSIPPLPPPIQKAHTKEIAEEAFEPIAEKDEEHKVHIPEIPKIAKNPKKSFVEKHPDFEKFIGENLINKIGIVILVLGLGYLVKYAIDKNWIDETARMAIGILSAGGLIAIAHRLRKDYKPFSSVLIGGGLALLYFTISLAFHTEAYPLYQMQTTSFIILIFITIFAVMLSIAYDRIEIAILAIVGGFASPLILSTGSGNYIVLFSYIMLLNVGMLVLSYYKKWRLVNIVAFGFTVLLFAIWLHGELDASRYIKFVGAILFASGFYLIFFLMNIIYNIKYNVKFKVEEISLLLSNTFIYFSFVMIMLSHINDGAYQGLFAVLLGAFNFIFAYLIHRRKTTDSTLLFLLIGLVFTFITLAIPLQLNGNYITLFWSLESVLLLWLGQKSGFKIMKIGSVVVLGLMLISIMMDWNFNYSTAGYSNEAYIKALPLIINKMFITTIVSVASLLLTALVLKNEEESFVWEIPTQIYRLIIIALALGVFYAGGFYEVEYQSYHYFANGATQSVAQFTFNALFALAFLIYAAWQKNKFIYIASFTLSAIYVLVFFVALSSVFAKTTYGIINGDELLPTTLLIFRWIAVFAVYAISILLYRMSKRMSAYMEMDLSKFSLTFLVFTIIYLLSADLDTIAVLIANSKDILVHTQKTGYAIIWGLSSFILMIIGMKRKNKSVRILSMVLFAITLVKLFVYDIAEISKGGKIVAFILLGVLLLIISFMYQRMKLLVTKDDYLETDNSNEADDNENSKTV